MSSNSFGELPDTMPGSTMLLSTLSDSSEPPNLEEEETTSSIFTSTPTDRLPQASPSASQGRPLRETEEIWDLVRVIPLGEFVPCTRKGCTKLAVAAWSTNLEPDNLWYGCEECQLEELGGWPVDLDLYAVQAIINNDDIETKENKSDYAIMEKKPEQKTNTKKTRRSPPKTDEHRVLQPSKPPRKKRRARLGLPKYVGRSAAVV